jgi:anti-sigma B factor antagonist
VDEVFSNAIEHGSAGSDSQVVIRCSLADELMGITVSDTGSGRGGNTGWPDTWADIVKRGARPGAERGNGLFLAHTMSDRMSIEPNSLGGVDVNLTVYREKPAAIVDSIRYSSNSELNDFQGVIKIRKSDISFEARTENDMVVISISGQLDAFASRDLRDELKATIDARNYRLILGFENVSYVDSSGIGAVVAAAQQVRKRKGDIKLFGMAADIHKVFDLIGASKVLEIFETEQEAMDSFS